MQHPSLSLLRNAFLWEIDFDILLEAKLADVAFFQLLEDVKVFKPEWTWLDKTTLEFQ